MPKILRILNRMIIGGPAINAAYLTKYMPENFETKLVIGGKDDHEKEATHLLERLNIHPTVIPEMRRSINPIQDRLAYIKMKALIEEYQPDIVHTHAAKSGTIGRLAAFSCKVPVVVHTFHGHVFHSYFNKVKTKTFINIERYLAKKSSGIIAISNIQKNELGNIYHICPPDKIKIIPLGLDLDTIQTDSDAKRQDFRAQYLIRQDELVIGIIGRLVPVKNHELFIAAITELIQRTNLKLKFVIVGDGDRRQAIEQVCVQEKLDFTYFPKNPREAQVVFTSWRTDVDAVLAGMDLVALTSHNEGTPLSLIEAQAAGKPVVSTDVGGVRDVVLDGKTGFIVPQDSAKAFADALLKLVENEALRKQFSAAGILHATSNFSYQ